MRRHGLGRLVRDIVVTVWWEATIQVTPTW
jgi:hypothetical protein